MKNNFTSSDLATLSSFGVPDGIRTRVIAVKVSPTEVGN